MNVFILELSLTRTLRFRIIELLASELDELITISEISKRLKVAYSHAHKFVQEMNAEGVLKIKKLGRVSVVQLNFEDQAIFGYLALIEYNKTKKWLNENPWAQRIYDKIKTKSGLSDLTDDIHCILYYKNKIIIVKPKKILDFDFKTFKLRDVITIDELKQNREKYRGVIILHGAEKYWKLLGK
ncbi:hypothetical protein HN814_01975 [Candidatus Woesearchaeota archaeon]|nr:hypothetical protein [Candidatus Woesearchaeota archaeon]